MRSLIKLGANDSWFSHRLATHIHTDAENERHRALTIYHCKAHIWIRIFMEDFWFRLFHSIFFFACRSVLPNLIHFVVRCLHDSCISNQIHLPSNVIHGVLRAINCVDMRQCQVVVGKSNRLCYKKHIVRNAYEFEKFDKRQVELQVNIGSSFDWTGNLITHWPIGNCA